MTTSWWRGAVLSAALITGLVAAPWGLTSARAARSVASASGATLTITFHDDFSHLDSALCYDTECYAAMKALYDRLVDYDTHHGSGDTIIPDAATALPTITNGGRTYTFKLRQDVRFWNGRPVTSADWVYSFERIINPKTKSGGQSFWLNIQGANVYANGKAAHVSGIKTLGTYGLSITLDQPDASFMNVLAMPFGSVVDRATIEKYGSSYDAKHPMGTGPFQFVSHTLGQQIVFARNPHYFGHVVGNLGKIVVNIGPTPEVALLQLERGSADVLGDGIPPADFLQVTADPTYKADVLKAPQVADYYIAMNEKVKPFDNLLVRQAVNMAINKQFILRLINGRGTVDNSVLPPNMPGYGPVKGYAYNPTAAKALLSKAGYPSGFSTVLYSDNIDPNPKIIAAIQPQLAQIGIKATLRAIDGNALQQSQSDPHKLPMVWAAWFEDFPDPSDFYGPILSCASAVPGTFNWSWTCQPKTDAFAQQLRVMTNQKERLSQYHSLDQMVMDHAPWVPVYHPIYYTMHGAGVRGIYYHDAWGLVYAEATK